MAKIAIIGCGLSGATAALLLHRAGHDVRIFERSIQIREAGAGIGLLTNAMHVLDSICLGDAVRARGHIFNSAELWSSNRRLLQHLDFAKIVGADAPISCIIHRADLLSIILQDLPSTLISTACECVAINPTINGVTISFSNQSSYDAELLIGADGVGSFVRRWLFGEDPLRYLGQTCFRGIGKIALNERHVIREVSGLGQRASAMPIDDQRAYWWAAINAEFGKMVNLKVRKSKLLDAFAGWPFSIGDAIYATPAESILQNDIVDRPKLSTWSRDRVVLLGDAAHPMAPNLGQGACTSIEDALVLSKAINLFPKDYLKAMAFYEGQRIARTSKIAQLSRLYGVPHLWKNPLAVASRDILTRIMPKTLLKNQFREILGHQAGLAT